MSVVLVGRNRWGAPVFCVGRHEAFSQRACRRRGHSLERLTSRQDCSSGNRRILMASLQGQIDTYLLLTLVD